MLACHFRIEHLPDGNRFSVSSGLVRASNLRHLVFMRTDANTRVANVINRVQGIAKYDTGLYLQPWQWETGAVAVFLAWMELILIIRKLPRFGIYVVMFTHILNTFVQFFVVFFLFLVGFAISFYMLLANHVSLVNGEE